jgi:4-amino-4-deoxychorismate lyase
MFRLVESIKVLNRQFHNLEYHQARVDWSRNNYLGLNNKLEFSENIYIPEKLSNDLFKCRIVYTNIVYKIEFIPYERKQVKTLQVVHADDIGYNYKYEDRNYLDELKKSIRTDDMIIIKNGFVTDAFSSNLIFSDGAKYFTPSTPLLIGTKRTKLLNENLIFEEEIREKDINKFKHVCLINAIMDLDEDYLIPTTNILY